MGNQFANISSLFYVTYVLFEVPWVLAVKKWGANSVMAIAIVSWSAITIGTGFTKNYGQVVAMRLRKLILLYGPKGHLVVCPVFFLSASNRSFQFICFLFQSPTQYCIHPYPKILNPNILQY